MPVKLRLKRQGRKKAPHYAIVAADSRFARDGRFIEKIGTYDPIKKPARVYVDNEAAIKWLSNGAQPTHTVRSLLRHAGVTLRYALIKQGKSEEEIERIFSRWQDEKRAKKVKKMIMVAPDGRALESLGEVEVATKKKEAPAPVTEIVAEEAASVAKEVKSAAGEVATEAEAVAEDVAEKAGDVAEKVETATEDVAEKAEAVAEKVEAAAEDVAEKAEAVAEKVAEKVETVAEDVAEKAEAVAEDVAEKTEAVVEKVAEKAEVVAEKVETVAEDVAEKAEAAAENVAEKAKAVVENVVGDAEASEKDAPEEDESK